MGTEPGIQAPSFAILDSQDELAARYKHVAPLPGQFTLQRPYQAPAETSTETRTGDKRRRKRKKTVHEPNEAERESCRRHGAFIPVLQAAFDAYKASRAASAAAVRPAIEIGAAEVIGRGEGAAELVLQGKEAEAQGLDFRSLGGMLRLLRPKFSSPMAAQPVDLFRRLIRNDTDEEQVCSAHEADVVLPAQCAFMMADVTHLHRLTLALDEPGFGCVVLDPPWENASAKRGNHYPTLPARRLLALPLPRLLLQDGLAVLWMTNRERHWRFVEAELLPAWGMKIAAAWFWLKVTSHGELVGPLECKHRRPYEPLLLLVPDTSKLRPLQDFVIVSVPGQHSRKPHLGRFLVPWLPPGCRRLEACSSRRVFARELVPGWTSFGDEVLHFQQLHFFQELVESTS